MYHGNAGCNVSITGTRIIEECLSDLFVCRTPDHPHERLASGFFAVFLVTLDTRFIHMQDCTLHQPCMDYPVDRLQPFLATTDNPTVVPGTINYTLTVSATLDNVSEGYYKIVADSDNLKNRFFFLASVE